MEDRVCKDAPPPSVDISVSENGTDKLDVRSPPLTPCSVVNKPLTVIPQACTPVQGHLVANKLLANPFATTSPVRHSFSTPNTSDSEDSKSNASSVVLRPSALTPKAQNMGQGLHRPVADGGPAVDPLPNVGERSFILKPAKLHNPLAKTFCETPLAKTSAMSTPSMGAILNNHNHFHYNNPFAKTIPEAIENESETSTGGNAKRARKSSESNGHHLAAEKMPTVTAKPIITTSVIKASSSCSRVVSKGAEEVSIRAGFVFGSNISERVVNAPSTTPSASETDASAPNLFAQTSPTATSSSSDSKQFDTVSPEKSLVESAKEYQAKHALKEYAEVECRTGEESESNVLHSNCKLFLFNKDSQAWTEKGRGLLRLNDMLPADDSQTFQSRIIMRTQGSLKVILNTKIWSGMMIEKASLKSLRLTAQDEDGSIKVYLITTSPKEADHIFTAVDWRVQQLKTHLPDIPDMPDIPDTPPEETKMAEKRSAEPVRLEVPAKKHRCEQKSSSAVDDLKPLREESNDSSTAEPETEASNSSSHSSPTIKSTSSE